MELKKCVKKWAGTRMNTGLRSIYYYIRTNLFYTTFASLQALTEWNQEEEKDSGSERQQENREITNSLLKGKNVYVLGFCLSALALFLWLV